MGISTWNLRRGEGLAVSDRQPMNWPVQLMLRASWAAYRGSDSGRSPVYNR